MGFLLEEYARHESCVLTLFGWEESDTSCEGSQAGSVDDL